MRIGITGATGFIGTHVRALLKARNEGHEVRLGSRDSFTSDSALGTFVDGLDAIVHLAAMIRGTDEDIETTNIDLARKLTMACEGKAVRPFVVFANSVHQYGGRSAYGRGKREAARLLRTWAERSGAGFANLILPHVFGEFGRPFYNSAVSTFCYQLASHEPPPFVSDGSVELLHVQAVADQCLAVIRDRRSGDFRLDGVPMAVAELLKRLRELDSQYRSQVMPKLETSVDVHLFNTLRSYLFPRHYPVNLQLRTDTRGSLFEAVKSLGGGQVFMSTTRPGVVRGNHFHTRKIERFLVISGEAEIRLRKLFSDDVIVFKVRGAEPSFVDMPTFYTHSITNTGSSDLLTLFWSNEIFDPADADTFMENVDLL